MAAADSAVINGYLERHQEDLVSLCQELVRIPSENPPGDTTRVAGFVADYLQGALQREGVPGEVLIVDPQKHMPNVILTVEGSRPGPHHLVFNGHLDTYPAGESKRWDLPAFSGEICDGKLYGRGAADMKGGLAASIFAFAALIRHRDLWCGKATLTASSDEETGGRWGTGYFLEHYPQLLGTALLNGEPSGTRMVSLGEKGGLSLGFMIRTPGGHGAYAFEESHHAIDIAADLITRLRSLRTLDLGNTGPNVSSWLDRAREEYDAFRGRGASEFTKKITVNTGVINGGLKVNMVPEHCWLEVDIRVPPGVTLEKLRGEVEEVLRDFSHHDIETSVIGSKEASVTTDMGPGSLYQAVKKHARESTGEEVFPIITLGGTDARFWRWKGIPGVVYGPEHYNMARANEYILVDSLLKVGRVQTLAALDYLAPR